MLLYFENLSWILVELLDVWRTVSKCNIILLSLHSRAKSQEDDLCL